MGVLRSLKLEELPLCSCRRNKSGGWGSGDCGTGVAVAVAAAVAVLCSPVLRLRSMVVRRQGSTVEMEAEIKREGAAQRSTSRSDCSLVG